MRFKPQKETWNERPYYIQLYIPSRAAIVLINEESARKHNITFPEYLEPEIAIAESEDNLEVKVE